MSLLIEVGDRGAWPVRALPWISGHDGPRWHLDAVDVASALGAATVEWVRFAAVRAWRADGSVIEPNDWLATAERLRRLRPDFPDYDEWRLRATLTLPADAFVWFEEWSGAYRACPSGPDHLRLLLDEPELDPDERRELEHEARARDLISQPQLDPGLAAAVMESTRLLAAPHRSVQPSSGVGLEVDADHSQDISQAIAAAPNELLAPTPASKAPPATIASSERVVKRKALVAELQHEWPGIEQHLGEASRNGLSAAAMRPKGWAVDAARQWARDTGVLRSSGGSTTPTLEALPRLVHRI